MAVPLERIHVSRADFGRPSRHNRRYIGQICVGELCVKNKWPELTKRKRAVRQAMHSGNCEVPPRRPDPLEPPYYWAFLIGLADRPSPTIARMRTIGLPKVKTIDVFDRTSL